MGDLLHKLSEHLFYKHLIVLLWMQGPENISPAKEIPAVKKKAAVEKVVAEKKPVKVKPVAREKAPKSAAKK